MDMAFFRSMVENGTGFRPGQYVDEYPHMGLVECIQASATDCMAAQIELAESVQAHNDKCTLAAHAFLTEGVSVDYEALAEAGKESLLQKIKNFFERIKKWVQSIIAKIKISIDKKRLTGKQFYERYKDNPGLQNIAAKNLTFNGYEMASADPFDLKFTAVEGLIDADAPDKVGMTKGGVVSKSKLDAIGDEKASDRQAKIAGRLTGQNLKGESWKEDLNKKIFGEKVDIKYGKGMFTLEAVRAQLLSAEGFENVLNSYKKVQESIEKSQQAMERTVEGIKEGFEKTHEKKDTPEKTHEIKEEASLTEYCNRYLSLYQEAINVLQSVQAIRVSYQDTRMNQAKRMFQMMITGKVEKKDNNDFELEAAEFDFDFA